jgi:hypothetical protein
MTVLGVEGLLMSLVLLILPFVILYVLFKVLPPWDDVRTNGTVPPPAEPETRPDAGGVDDPQVAT